MAKVLTGPRGQGRLPPVPLFVNPEFQDHYDQVRQYNFESTLRAPPVPLFVNPEIESIPQTKESQPTDFQKSSPPIETPLQQAQPAPQQIARQPQFQQQIPVQRVTQPAPNTVPPQEWPGHFQPSGPNSEPPLYPWTPQPSQAPQGGARLAKPYQPPEQPPQDAYNKQRQQNWQGENDNQRPDYRKKVHQHQNHHHHHHGSHQIPHQHHHHHHQQLVQTQLQFPPQFHQHTQIQQIQHIAVPAQPIPVQQAVVVQPIQVQQPAVSQPQPQHNYRRPQDSSPPQTDGTPLDPGIAALLAVVPTAKIASGGPVENDYNDRDEEGEGRAVYCYNCGGTDHTVKNCKKPLFCTFCSKWGHTSNVCFKKKGDTAFNKTLDEVKAKAEGETPPPPREARFKGCFNCGGEDHTVKDCREKLYCTVCNKDGHTANKCKRCHNCGGHHMLKECQLPRQCKQCGSAKHTANVCTEIIKKPTEQTQDTPKEDEKPSEEPTQEKEPSPPQEHNTEAAAVVE